MKTLKEFITEKVDDLALTHFHSFYDNLHPVLRQSIWAMATREYQTYCLGQINNTNPQERLALGGKG